MEEALASKEEWHSVEHGKEAHICLEHWARMHGPRNGWGDASCIENEEIDPKTKDTKSTQMSFQECASTRPFELHLDHHLSLYIQSNLASLSPKPPIHNIQLSIPNPPRPQTGIGMRALHNLAKQLPEVSFTSAKATNNPKTGFQPPKKRDANAMTHGPVQRSNGKKKKKYSEQVEALLEHPLCASLDPMLMEIIVHDVLDASSAKTSWKDIAGLSFAKRTITELIVFPLLRPDIFHGIRAPPKGLLLFGPPGNGKTLIGRAIAAQCKATFFSISASSLTSKWVGEGEKLVRTLFTIARCKQPAVVFIDEIDSLLTQRSGDEHEGSRRLKTEILIQMEGATTSSEDRFLVIGATNRPQEIDGAARRRFVKRLYIPLPCADARRAMLHTHLKGVESRLTNEEIEQLVQGTDGYSGADMKSLCAEAALAPFADMDGDAMEALKASDVRPLVLEDIVRAQGLVRPSVGKGEIDVYEIWNRQFGTRYQG